MRNRSPWLGVLFIAVIASMSSSWGRCQESPQAPPVPVKVAEGVYLLSGDLGCNVAASVGPDGVLIIDSGLKETVEQVLASLRKVSGLPVRIVMDTHFHFDHVGGNEAFGRAGALIISQERSRLRMTQPWDVQMLGNQWPKQEPYPDAALARVTFVDSLTVHVNGEEIEATHLPSAHSDGDAVIRLKKANVIHAGDLFLSNGFTVLDLGAGGTVHGYLAAVDRIIGLCDEKTIVIPGHGPVSNREGVRSFRKMLTSATDRVAALVKAGKTLDEVLSAELTKGLYPGGESWLDPRLFVYCAYADLTEKR